MSQPQIFYDTAVQGTFSTSWIYIPFGFFTKGMVIISPKSTNSDDIYYSWDGVNIHGRVTVSDLAVNLQNQVRAGIYLKANSGNQGAEITAY